jgi:CxxC motif-containing protein (DUF1111 family)
MVCFLVPVGCSPETGLGPPAEVDPLTGEPGEPIADLTTTETEAFEAGKTAFETAYSADDGFGTPALATSCVGCHGEPATGGTNGLTNFAFTSVSGTKTVGFRIGNALFGLGLFERVSDNEILSRQDPTDVDGDGVSGRPNLEGDRVGRFGRKAQAATLESITRGMLFNQMGLTSEPIDEASADAASQRRGWLERIADALESFSFAQRAYAQAAPPATEGDPAGDDDAVADPEVSTDNLAALLAFMRNLAAPKRGEITDAVLRGEVLFETIGCAACHTPTLTTEDGDTIHPYSDLLIHYMGERSFDNIEVGVAEGTEFRTQPLWGLRNVPEFLHNADANTIEGAIDGHAGEAEASREAYDALEPDQQQDLLEFLNSL